MGIFKSLFGSKQDKAEKQAEKNFDILKFDGLRAQRMGRFDYAERCFTEALKLRDDYETLGYLSKLLMRMGRHDDALPYYEQMHQAEPQAADPLLGMAEVYLMRNDYETMRQVAQQAVEAAPQNVQAYYMLGRALQGIGYWYDAAQTLGQAIAIDDTFIDAYLLRAEVLLRKRDYRGAQADVRSVLELIPDDENALLLQGRIMEGSQHPQSAEQSYRQVLEANPFCQNAYILLARLYSTHNRLDDCKQLMDDAIELDEHFADAYLIRGNVRRRLGDEEGAKADEQQARLLHDAQMATAEVIPDPPQPQKTDILGL